MKLILTQRERLSSLGAFLVDELDSLVARIRGAWNVEHNDDDTHGHVHADSVATGRLTFSDIIQATINQAQVDNFTTEGLSTAAMLRFSGAGSGGANPTILLTGIKLPQDENGAVLDGRVLVIENSSLGGAHTYIALSHEDSHSLPSNRFALPYAVEDAATSAQVVIAPGSLMVVVYDAKQARWVVQSQSNENIVASAASAVSDVDFSPDGFEGCRTLLIDKTVKSLTIGGFDSTNIPTNAKKTIVNVGLYSFDILHANYAVQTQNRVYCPGQTRYRLHPRESVDLYRQSEGGWRLVVSEKADQWVDVTHAAGNFTTDVGTWTVAAGDQITLNYQIDGNKMTVSFDLRTTSVATNPTQLRIAIPAGRIAARSQSIPIVASNAGTQISTAFADVFAGGTYIRILRDLASTAWSAATDTTRVTGEITFMVRENSVDVIEPHSDVAHADAAHSDVAHSDVAHSDVAHGDSHGDASHSDVSHQDVAHSDSAHTDTPHEDVAHSDGAHSDSAHEDVTHVDVAHGDEAHQDAHTDEVELPPEHTDVAHVDTSHFDTPHEDVAHSDADHADVAHSDVAHVDTAHVDTAHSDSAHVDGGHSDTHSDTVPHSDAAHADAAHADTVHADAIHADVGMHFDTAHVDT